jgi:hypothetical protein
MEAVISTNPLVGSALIVGQARFQAAALIEPASTQNTPESPTDVDKFIEEVWPAVEKANNSAPSHGRINRSHVRIVAPNTFLRAGKGTVQRFQSGKILKHTIDDIYRSAEKLTLSKAPKYDTSSYQNLEDCIRTTVKQVIKSDQIQDEDDIFVGGADSLHVVSIQKRLKAGLKDSAFEGVIDPRFVYAHPSITLLARAVYEIVENGSVPDHNAQASVFEMQCILEDYTINLAQSPLTKAKAQGKDCVILTGSTGSLGSYILEILMGNENVDRVWCLNRSKDAAQRQLAGNLDKGLRTDFSPRIQFLHADLSKADLGLSNVDYTAVVQNATHIIRKCMLLIDYHNVYIIRR